jgi:hypothetical protein
MKILWQSTGTWQDTPTLVVEVGRPCALPYGTPLRLRVHGEGAPVVNDLMVIEDRVAGIVGV